MLYVTKNGGITSNKSAIIIENMLGMKLSQKQFEKIKDGWNAFYNDPLKYKNTIVVEMVKLYLQED